MVVAVQRIYRPQIAPAFEGMPADQMRGPADISRNVETAAGIAFGRAVSQGTRDYGVIIGGSAFVGCSMRDPTVALAPVDPLAAAGSANPLDSYGQYTSAWVRTGGRIWVRAAANVAAGNALFYNTTSGLFTNSASGTAASGSITFSQQPTDGQTVIINGVTFTFKASGATGDQANIGPTLGDTINNAVAALNASGTAGLTTISFQAYPPSPGGAGQGSGANQILLGVKAVGVAGNAYTLAAGTLPGVTFSGATLSGGTAAATAITGGRWNTTAITGDLAIVNLGVAVA